MEYVDLIRHGQKLVALPDKQAKGMRNLGDYPCFNNNFIIL